ncbi:NAD-dependent deacetylase [Ammoniphilus sp. 3BR4]|uniref:SIR2 family NAD-dependent protein deacylase n=1 Tax=Ammoniphilus sp. 3BR4 TaxID=3158265 RepID=UPI0034677F08
MNESEAQLAAWLKESNNTVVLTGAGMSTESGLPDFRSKSGWWKNIDPTTVASVQALKDNYALFHEFYKTRMEDLGHSQPHEGHFILAQWEKRGLVRAIATQNVDGFHQKAGSQKVYELHGSIRSARCHNCSAPVEMDQFLGGEPCGKCGGKLRPNVVLFGEMLPEEAWDQSISAIRMAELVVVIGTSLQVYPVNQLPKMTKGKIAIINLEPTDQDKRFDLAIYSKAGEALMAVEEFLR